MLKKRQIKKNNITKVTFILPGEVAGQSVHLVGDFNEWQATQAMKRQRDNTWKLTLDLEPDSKYQFRYLVDEQDWFNDPEADSYVPNPYGEQNSVAIT
ncbi:MAG: isoamylase early set domain-containing protein [Candidatus Promineifilaceae bacterium]